DGQPILTGTDAPGDVGEDRLAVVGFGHIEAVDDGQPILTDVTRRIGPGARTGILGPNGAGKSTLLGLVSGEIEPDSGRVNHGKTVEIGVLDQQFKDLARISDSRVREVLAESKTSFTVEGKDYTPAQLLERLG